MRLWLLCNKKTKQQQQQQQKLHKALLDSDQALNLYLLPQSTQRMSLPLATKRLLDRLREHLLQLKQYSCQELPS